MKSKKYLFCIFFIIFLALSGCGPAEESASATDGDSITDGGNDGGGDNSDDDDNSGPASLYGTAIFGTSIYTAQ